MTFGLASILAPLSVPVSALFFIVVVSGAPSNLDGVFLFWVSIISYFGFFVFGLPLALILRKYGRLYIWSLVLGGAAGGAVVAMSIFLFLRFVLDFGAMKNIFGATMIFAILGSVVALSFGLLARVSWSKNSESKA